MGSKSGFNFEWNEDALKALMARAQFAADQIGAELDAGLRAFSAENAGNPMETVAVNLVEFWSQNPERESLSQEQIDLISDRVSAGGVVYIKDSHLMVSDPGEDV